jgi:hypothetical protein
MFFSGTFASTGSYLTTFLRSIETAARAITVRLVSATAGTAPVPSH